MSIVSTLVLGGASAVLAQVNLVPPSDPLVAVMGRGDRTDPSQLRFGYPGVTLRVRFEGAALGLRVASETGESHLAVILDGGEPRAVKLAKGESDVTLAEGLTGDSHSIDVVHRTETWKGVVTVRGFLLGAGGRLLPPDPFPRRRMLFIGDSVTCGEGAGTERRGDCGKDSSWWNAYLSYGMRLARTFDAQCHLVCFGGRGVLRDWRGKSDVLNAPQFFDLAVPEDAGAPAWDHAGYVPDVVFVSLGTNDFSLSIGPLPDREAFVSAYVRFLRAIRARHPAAHVFLTEGAIVSDEADPQRPQRTVLREHLVEVARRLGDGRVLVVEARHYPGDACDAHPTGEQHAAMARDLEPVIRAALGW
jgi:lysophospholipase L1-like esterase